MEEELLKSPEKLCFMNNLLKQHQFSEEFLIKTIYHYDSWKCLNTQKNLSPFFCFRYLYDNDSDSADDWTDYNQVYEYLTRLNYSEDEIVSAYNKATDDKIKQIKQKVK